MPNIKSAKKRVSVIERRKQENRYVKSTISTLIKNFKNTAKSDVAEAEKMLNNISSYIDSAVSKGVIHKNNASRKISRLNLFLSKVKSEQLSPKTEEVVPVAQEEVEEVKAETTEKKRTTKKSK